MSPQTGDLRALHALQGGGRVAPLGTPCFLVAGVSLWENDVIEFLAVTLGESR